MSTESSSESNNVVDAAPKPKNAKTMETKPPATSDDEEEVATKEYAPGVGAILAEADNTPAEEDHRTKIVGLMGELYQMGQKDIKERIAGSLKKNNIEGGLRGLTTSEANALIAALEHKQLDKFFEHSLVGHVKANAGNE